MEGRREGERGARGREGERMEGRREGDGWKKLVMEGRGKERLSYQTISNKSPPTFF